jgi:hypothetical protein
MKLHQGELTGEISTERNRANLRRIGNGQGLEDTPGDTAENLGDLQGFDVLRREEDSREDDDERETDHDGEAIAKAFGNNAVDEETDDFAYVGAVAETSLPGRGNLVASIR